MAGKQTISKEVQEKVCTAIGLGAPYELAALYAGIGRATVWKWIQRGEREKKGVYRDFAEAVKESEGLGVIACLATIRKAGEKYWQAAAWLLERRYRTVFGRSWVDDTPAEEREKTINIRIDVATLQAELTADLVLLERLKARETIKDAEIVKGGNGNGHDRIEGRGSGEEPPPSPGEGKGNPRA